VAGRQGLGVDELASGNYSTKNHSAKGGETTIANAGGQGRDTFKKKAGSSSTSQGFDKKICSGIFKKKKTGPSGLERQKVFT